MKKRLLSGIKAAWAVLVFAGAAWYLTTHFDSIAGELRQIAAWRLGAAILCLVGGKLLLVVLSRASVNLAGQDIPYRRMFHINAMSQLAKYLPGGIWHFAGRAGYYHAAGLTPRQNTAAIIIENLWLVSSAALFGVVAFGFYSVGALRGLVVAAGVIGLAGVLMFAITRWRALTFRPGWTLALIAAQAGTWLLIGLSLWVLFPVAGGLDFLLLAVSGFAVSWVVGYVSLFAPSGLGVRELVLTAVLGLAVAAPTALVYATINRVIWMVTELLLALAAQGLDHAPQAAPGGQEAG